MMSASSPGTTPCAAMPLQLAVQVLYVYDHAGAHDVRDALAQYAARQEVQYELPPLVHDGVAGVVAALIAADDVVVLR